MEAQDFDGWSKSYDESVLKQETYPFAGYDEIVMEVIQQTVGPKVLDLGVGVDVIIVTTGGKATVYKGFEASTKTQNYNFYVVKKL